MANSDFIYGKNPVIEALERGEAFEKILVAKGSPLYQEVRKAVGAQRIFIQSVPEEKLNRITRKNHQGLIGYKAFITYHDLDNILAQTYEKGETPLFIALDGVTDVGNMGAIARSAFCFGAHGIIVPEKGSALINAVAVKASAGAIQQINFAKVVHLKDNLTSLQTAGIQVIAATMSKQSKRPQDIDFSLPTCIVMGNEEKGVGPNICALADHEVNIPMSRKFDSLNVSVATGILLYEANSQRTIQGG